RRPCFRGGVDQRARRGDNQTSNPSAFIASPTTWTCDRPMDGESVGAITRGTLRICERNGGGLFIGSSSSCRRGRGIGAEPSCANRANSVVGRVRSTSDALPTFDGGGGRQRFSRPRVFAEIAMASRSRRGGGAGGWRLWGMAGLAPPFCECNEQ